MIIDLPKQFTLCDELGKVIAYVQDGRLYLRYDAPFKHLMYELTYSIYGKDKCYCCGKEVKKNQITLDHIIPQDYGGPDITNNLIPYCRECNNEKDNIMLEQFKEYLYLKTKDHKKRDEYIKKMKKQNEVMKYDKEFSYLGDWVQQMKLSVIRGYKERVSYSTKKTAKQNKQEKIADAYKKYGRLPKPILVDCKKHLLSGYVALMYAKNNKITEVPVILLENVEVFY